MISKNQANIRSQDMELLIKKLIKEYRNKIYMHKYRFNVINKYNGHNMMLQLCMTNLIKRNQQDLFELLPNIIKSKYLTILLSKF